MQVSTRLRARPGLPALGAALAAAAAFAVVAMPAQPAGAAAVRPPANTNPAFLEVFVDNVENLETTSSTAEAGVTAAEAEKCKGDWQDLIYAMTERQYAPDLFIVQQVSGQSQLQTLASKMTELLGFTYRAEIIADPSPSNFQGSECTAKHYQTNGIIYREGRFTYNPAVDPHATWQAQRLLNGSCTNNTQDRTKGVKARLKDQITGQYVSVASVHWPSAQLGGPDCADSNGSEVRSELNEAEYNGSALKIWGGDSNITDLTSTTASSASYRSWFATMNGDLSTTYYRDVIFDDCRERTSDVHSAAFKQCLITAKTLVGTNRRIDFLMASRNSSALPFIDNEVTVDPNVADQADINATGSDNGLYDYSNHLAVGARVHYAATG